MLSVVTSFMNLNKFIDNSTAFYFCVLDSSREQVHKCLCKKVSETPAGNTSCFSICYFVASFMAHGTTQRRIPPSAAAGMLQIYSTEGKEDTSLYCLASFVMFLKTSIVNVHLNVNFFSLFDNKWV